MKGIIELILKAEEARIGRAVKSVFSGIYKVNIVKKIANETRAYVVNESKEYAVVISDTGQCFCSCHDRFVNENICKHIIMVILERIYDIHEKIPKEKGGEKDDKGIVPNA